MHHKIIKQTYLHNKYTPGICMPMMKQVNNRTKPETPMRRKHYAWLLPHHSMKNLSSTMMGNK